MFTRHSDNQSQCCIDNDTVVTCFYMNNKTVKMMIFTLIQTGSSSLFNIFIRFSYTCSANRMPVQGGRGASGLSKHITGKSTAKNKRKRKVTWSHTVHYGNNGFEAADNCITNTKWDHKVWKDELVLKLHVYSKVVVHLQPHSFISFTVAVLFSCILSLS